MSVQDELEIRNLVARYGDAVCRRDAVGWAANWTEDCVWDLGGGRVTHGRDAALELWQASLTKYPWVAQVPASGMVAVDGDSATGTWYVIEFNHRADGTGTLHVGHYRDRYARTAEGWRFAARAFHMLYRGALDPGVVVPLPGTVEPAR